MTSHRPDRPSRPDRRRSARTLAATLLGCALLAGPAVALAGASPSAKSGATAASGTGARVQQATGGEWRYCPYTGTHPELGKGHANDAVGHLQCILNKVYGYKSVTVDKIFGDATLAAVKNFQQSVGLTADGFVGPNTWAALHP
ncbi:glycosyltransferase [Streptomyces sp. WAC 01529]|uniref:peptidoglycan-binding domain-containing protein n=1 Tax=Streptomyces sp. WAC 01529 TaxID=2203205 RepID=UPI000F6B3D1E|nr:peptidoglycan-binding domain-containing protein [Streptomyces sp. WAC 01529]AZM51960.1 glycosyltransferase [Streptomyces sp. WAC 01529]